MYIGRIGDGSNLDDGIYILLKEVIDNSIDEFIMGHGKKIMIQIKGKQVVVRDYGRGIPLGKVVECVSLINTGAKYDDDVFQFSVGLNGVGTKAVNALSEHFRVVSFRKGEYSEAIFKRGVLTKQNQGKKKDEPDGTYVEFIPDEQIFGKFAYNHEFIEQRIWNYAYLNSGLCLVYNKEKYESKHGLLDLLETEVGDNRLYDIAYHRGDKLEFSLTHTDAYGESFFSFVNGQYTADGGTHLSAFREGILKAVNEFLKTNYSGVDVRDGMSGAIAVKVANPVFESQTKNKLGNTEVRTWILAEVKSALVDYLLKNKDVAKKLEEKIVSNERLRKDLNEVKKEAREAAKKVSLKIPKLKDCRFHLGDARGEESTIFLTEGDSASGSMVSARDVNTQAIFSLRGKLLNVFGKKRAEIYKNEELYNMMIALGIENGLEGLRYGKVVIATDADNDGFHIRNLLMTYFLTYFEELVITGRVYILETPLFRVRNKKETVYCYSENERDQAVEKLTGDPEVTRFKGLGEINPSEFGQFIGGDMRLVPINVKSIKSVPQTLDFFMGKNTPQRRDFIMENLI
jgi:topoisomerase-4 subunit B